MSRLAIDRKKDVLMNMELLEFSMPRMLGLPIFPSRTHKGACTLTGIICGSYHDELPVISITPIIRPMGNLQG